MMYGLSIDPGVSSGVCLFCYDDETPMQVIRVWQFRGGASALRRFLDHIDLHVTERKELWISYQGKDMHITKLVVEKFTPRPNETFSLTQEAVEPLRGEGVLIGRELEDFIIWREPAQQYFMGGDDKPEKKKRSREFLKLHGMYVTGKAVGQPDADDAISATLHAIGSMRKGRHMPTLKALFGGGNNDRV